MEERTEKRGLSMAVSNVIVALIALLIVTMIIGTLAVVGVMGMKFYTESKKPQVDSAFISNKLEAVSTLSTAVLTYNGLIKYEEGEIPLIDKKSFSMVYSAEITAGVDLSKVESEITDTQVILILPEVEIQDMDIDENSVQFYDNQISLFNWTEKEDTLDAISLAKDDVREHADISGLKLKAKDQTETILEGLFEGAIGDRELVIEWDE